MSWHWELNWSRHSSSSRVLVSPWDCSQGQPRESAPNGKSLKHRRAVGVKRLPLRHPHLNVPTQHVPVPAASGPCRAGLRRAAAGSTRCTQHPGEGEAGLPASAHTLLRLTEQACLALELLLGTTGGPYTRHYFIFYNLFGEFARGLHGSKHNFLMGEQLGVFHHGF